MANTELFVQRQPGGPFTIADLRMAEGDVYYVNSTKTTTGADSVGMGRSPDYPFLTIDYAIGIATASQGDLIIVDANHAETITASITMDKIGLTILGLGVGMNRPVITPSGTIDAVTMTAARSRMENIMFAGPLVDTQTADVNIDAQYCSLVNTYHIGSVGTENKVSIVTITANGDDCLIDGIRIFNDTVEMPSGILIEGAATNVEIKNFYIADEVGFTDGAIADAATATGVNIHNGYLTNVKGATAPAMIFSNNSEGSVHNIMVNGRHTTIANNVTPGTGMSFFENYVVEEAQKNALWGVAPVVDA